MQFDSEKPDKITRDACACNDDKVIFENPLNWTTRSFIFAKQREYENGPPTTEAQWRNYRLRLRRGKRKEAEIMPRTQFEYKRPMATATLPDRSSLLCCSGPRLLWICNTSLFVSGTTECDESHRRAYLRRIKYLHARFLTVIPLPGHFDLPLASLDSHVFYNAVDGLSVPD